MKLTSSFRDPSGFLFQDQGELFRQINQSYASNYDQLMQSGLYQALVDEGFLIPHEEVSQSKQPGEGAYKVIRPEPIQFISYPYEWSFSQLKDAALATLHIQKRALKFGMSLKDSSAFNIQFHQGRPVLIDTLSFEPSTEGKPWVAYRQYCQHFLAPLALMSYVDIRLGNLLRTHIDGIPLDLASTLLPARTRLSFAMQTHIHLHARAQKRYARTSIKSGSYQGRSMGKYGLVGILDNLESATNKLEWRPEGTAWGDYYSFHGYDQGSFEQKKTIVTEFFESLHPKVVWDLGANIGLFSRIASDAGVATIAFDVDPAAVELNYLECRRRSERALLPLVLDLTNPSPNLGWAHEERSSLVERGPADLVFALALIHHLSISNNVPLSDLSDFFHRIARWIVIEFVPKEDPQVQRLLISREDIFETYSLETFEATFNEHFHIHRKVQIEQTQRTLFLMENRKNDFPKH